MWITFSNQFSDRILASDLSCSWVALSHCWLILPLIGVVYLREIIVALVVVIDLPYCWFILSVISIVVLWMTPADNICKMIEFLIDNIFVQSGGRLFRQVIGIPMGTNCAPLLADLFLYSYENEFLDNMIRSGHRRLARSFNLCYRYTDDLIVFNNKKFMDYLKEIHPSKLTAEKANKSDHLADYLDLTFIIDNGGKLFQKGYLTNVMILISTLSIFHTFPATYHLALLMVCTFHSSLYMHDAAHTMMISDTATRLYSLET